MNSGFDITFDLNTAQFSRTKCNTFWTGNVTIGIATEDDFIIHGQAGDTKQSFTLNK